MFNAKTIILAKALRPDLNFASPGAEELIWLKIASRYASGNPVRNATIENGIATFGGVVASQPLVSLKLNIPVTQTGSGTPSPDNIRDIIPVSGVNVSRTGKNLFDESIFAQYGGVLQTDGTWYIVNVATLLNVSVYEPPAGYTGQLTILLRRKNEAGKRSLRFRIYYTDGTYDFIGLENATGDLDIYTLVTNASKTVQSVTGDYGYNVPCYFNLMIAKGSIVTPYEPYTGNAYAISFGQTVYSANLDVLTGKLSITHELKTIDENSSAYMSSTTTSVFIVDNFFNIEKDTDSVDCNIYQRAENRSSTTDVINNNPDYSFCCRNALSEINNDRLMIKDTRFTSTEDYNTWLSTNPVKIAVKLATPIEIQLTPTQITTLIGENVIFADVANVTECKYTRK